MHIPFKTGLKKDRISHSFVRMYGKFQLAFKYIHYYLTAANGKGHGMHSPFVFDFIRNVLNDKRFFYAYGQVEHLREQLLLNDTQIEVQDYGAGSSVMPSRIRSVKDIAKWSLKSPKYAQLLFRMVHYYQPGNIVELGTSFGITTSYLASAGTASEVFTFEGADTIAELAKRHFSQLKLRNIQLTEGSFDIMLPPALQKIGRIDLAFVDGNHLKTPTLNYFNWLLAHANSASIFIFDDIHWSAEMEEAWQVIQSHASVTCSIDLFFIGIVFFTTDFKVKQHFTIRF